MAFEQSKIALTGGLGMLGAELIQRLQRRGIKPLLTDQYAGERFGLPVTQLDITEESEVRTFVTTNRPDWIVNCAAFTAVDDAEKKASIAMAVNAAGPGNLASALQSSGGRLLHISSDYVFGAATPAGKRTPFREEDPIAPCGVYGKSKAEGDVRVAKLLPDRHLIVRTSWLHGAHGPNFVATILRIARERSEIRVVDDQVGSPTWAGWLASCLMRLMEGNVSGVVHASSRGDISWCDFAKEIVRQARLSTVVLPQSTAEAGRPAPRPAYSTLDVSKLERILGERCIDWKSGVSEHLRELSMSR